jgi:signal transduction histidine kinase
LETFFEQNDTLIVFVHGVVLFALGFGLWLQRRRATRLALTSSLIWLASFAFLEALVVWGYVFIPIQATYLAPEVVESLVVLRGILQSIAVVFLLQFGLRLVPWTRRRLVPFTMASVVLWGGVLVLATVLAGEEDWSALEWEATLSALARYLFVVPGALLAAYGMWVQRDELTREGIKGVRAFAAIASWAFLAYALVGGLVVEPAPWAPGLLASEAGWFEITGLPLAVLRTAVVFVLLMAFIKLLDIFEVEAVQREEVLDRARLVAEERARFGRDLHDGTIQSIYASGLHLEAIALNTPDSNVRDEVRRVVGGLNATIDGLRGYIRGLQAPGGGPAGIASDVDQIVTDFGADTQFRVTLRVTGVETCGPLPDDAGENLRHIVREALANVSRHAGPCAVEVGLAFRPDEITLIIADGGCGFDPAGADRSAPGHGNGVRNMQERARRLGGRVFIEPNPAGGTRVVLEVPLDDVEATEIPVSAPGLPDEVITR